jgi:hypothetical protein
MGRRGFNWKRVHQRMRVVEQNIVRKHRQPVLGPKVKVRPAIPELKLPQGDKKK